MRLNGCLIDEIGFCTNLISKCLSIMRLDLRKVTLFNGGTNNIETSPLICRVNQWTGFCMIGTSVMKESKIVMKFHVFSAY